MKKHLSVFGVGPLYTIIVVFVTIVFFYLENKNIVINLHNNIWDMVGNIIGILFIIVGFILWANAVIINKIAKNIRENNLVTSGAYKYVRNPIYTAVMFVLSGVIFYHGNIILISLILFYYIFLSILLKNTEEKWLLQVYGEEYINYCKKVNRCIPWIK